MKMKKTLFLVMLLCSSLAFGQQFPAGGGGAGYDGGAVTNPFLAPDGSASATGFGFTGNTDMGLYRSTEQLFIQNTQNNISGRTYLSLNTEQFDLNAYQNGDDFDVAQFACYDDGADDMECYLYVNDGSNQSTTTFANTGTTFTDPTFQANGAAGTPSYSFTNNTNAGTWATANDLWIGEYVSATNQQYCRFYTGDVVLCKSNVDASNNAQMQLNPAGATFDVTGFFGGTNTYVVGGNYSNNETYMSAADGTRTVKVSANHNGGVKVSTTGTKPTCSSTTRGSIWFVQSGASTADTAEICAKNSSDTYAWYALATIP
jgi:hypothetical protein